MVSTFIACCVMMRCVALVRIARIVVGESVALGWVRNKHCWHGGVGSVN